MLMFPKPKRKIKARRPLRRARKPIAKRAVFKGYDPTGKRSKRYRSDFEVMAKAREYQAERRRKMSAAQQRFNELLDNMGILYESEAIIQNGDRFILIDALMQKEKIAFEVDGPQHQSESKYDAGRDAWLLRTHRIRTMRFSTKDVFRAPAGVRKRIREVVG